ncbi:BEN domain-containing protein 6 isoform X2 [Brachyhypopomus gauderio]|uniref:BEN domain-containing protein 6 isoform X2 n=1 Tax=Brachyhypopomus gauderio TaxID=698409 RepID=UPI004042FD3A
MRKKTKAKRILDYENEEDEEEEQTRDEFCHGLQKRRKQMYPAKDRREEHSSAAASLQKLDLRGYELDRSPADNFTDGHATSEEADFLQSYSKMELIAMVLCMQREMESLKEQLRCLTACGKLAQNLETLIEKTQVWPNGENTPSLPLSPSTVRVPMEMDDLMPSRLCIPSVLNGQWVKQESVTQISKESSSRDGLFTEFITPELLERCNTGTTAQKLTNDLLRGLYERDCLASHSISGVVYNKRGQPKPALPTEEVQAILRTVQYFFPGKTDAEIKGYIRQKLQNEAKRLRKRPPLSSLECGALSLSCPRSSPQLDLIGQKS